MKAPQQSLKNWTAQKWRTKSGKPSTQGPKATGERYLPKKAIKSLSPSEYAATTRAKREGLREGKQFVIQPKKIAKKTSQRFSQFRQTVNDLSPMIDKVLCQFGDQVWGFTTKTDYKYEKRWYGSKQVPYKYEIKNYVIKDWEYIDTDLIYIIVGEKNYITGEFLS